MAVPELVLSLLVALSSTVQSQSFARIHHNVSVSELFHLSELFPSRSTLAPKMGPHARITHNYNVAALPCCRDRLGEIACQAIRKTQAALFEKRCLNDHDFHMNCCSQCRSYIEHNKIHPENARPLFKAPQFCRDKRSIVFCRKFKTDGIGKFSCSDAEFAIRLCRQSCGYCNDALYTVDRLPPPCE